MRADLTELRAFPVTQIGEENLPLLIDPVGPGALNDRRLVALATYLLVRAGELEALSWDDIDLEHGTVHIHLAIERKKDKETTVKTEYRGAIRSSRT